MDTMDTQDEQRLWRRVRPDVMTPAPHAVEAERDAWDFNVLTAYIEDCATPEEAEAVERAMLADPELLETVCALRATGAEAEPAGRFGREKVIRLGWAWTAAAAAVAVLCAVQGFSLGQTYQETTTASGATAVTDESSAPFDETLYLIDLSIAGGGEEGADDTGGADEVTL